MKQTLLSLPNGWTHSSANQCPLDLMEKRLAFSTLMTWMPHSVVLIHLVYRFSFAYTEES